MLILSGEDRFNKDAFLRCDKHYTAEIIVGIATDTDDIFGVITSFEPINKLPENYTQSLYSLCGTVTQPLPSYSGYRLNGKPLWAHTMHGDPKTIYKKSTIHSVSVVSTSILDINQIIHGVDRLCEQKSLSGFRTNEIYASWHSLPQTTVLSIEISAHVSSGTFIRSIASNFGNAIGAPCCAYHITRTEITIPTMPFDNQ